MCSLGTSSMPTSERKHRIFVVEDEALINMLLEDMILDCGGEVVGPVARFDDALELARKAEFEVAVLDIKLDGTLSYPIAEVIRERGIPVIFATGYGADGLPDRFRDCPTLQKPFSLQDFAEAVAAACREQATNRYGSRRIGEGAGGSGRAPLLQSTRPNFSPDQ